MNIAKISDLKVDPKTILTPMVKKELVNIIYQEFQSQSTIYNAQAEAKRENILEQYKESVGYTKLRKDYDKAVSNQEAASLKVIEAEKKIHLKGLAKDGSLMNSYNTSDETKKAIKKVSNLLDVVNEQGPNAVKNKIISRIWLASTNGEAMVILREVLGNGIIPSIDVKDLPAIGFDNG